MWRGRGSWKRLFFICARGSCRMRTGSFFIYGLWSWLHSTPVTPQRTLLSSFFFDSPKGWCRWKGWLIQKRWILKTSPPYVRGSSRRVHFNHGELHGRTFSSWHAMEETSGGGGGDREEQERERREGETEGRKKPKKHVRGWQSEDARRHTGGQFSRPKTCSRGEISPPPIPVEFIYYV